MSRVRGWFDPGTAAPVWAGLVWSVLSVAAVTLLIYPLKQLFGAGPLDALYIPVVLFLAAKWNIAMGIFASILGALGFTYFHVEPLYKFSGLGGEAVAFLAVVVGAMYVHVATLRARSAEELRRQEVIARGRLVLAGDEERRRLVRDLHDGAQQRLATTAIALRAALESVDSAHRDETRELVKEALEQAVQANGELRALAQGILPPVLTRGGLPAAVKALVSRMTLPVTVEVPAERFDAAIEATAYFIISEALTNVIKHARAHHATVSAAVRDGQLHIEVSDDGIGGAHADGITGLVGLEDRVSAMGGRLVVHSPRGSGTHISAFLPVPE